MRHYESLHLKGLLICHMSILKILKGEWSDTDLQSILKPLRASCQNLFTTSNFGIWQMGSPLSWKDV